MERLLGRDAVKRSYEGTLKDGDGIIRCFTNYKAAFDWDREFFEGFYFPSRVRLGIKVKNIAAENPEGQAEALRAQELLREMRFVQTDFTGEINICPGYVAIISFGENPSVVLIENEDTVKAIRLMFDCLWAKLSS
jgi:hypothetical protein